MTIAAGGEPCHGVGKPKTNGSIARMQFGLINAAMPSAD